MASAMRVLFSANNTQRLQQFRKLHQELSDSHSEEIAPRHYNNQEIHSDVWAIGQAMGRRTQLLTGRPFVMKEGVLSSAGRKLENLMARISHTVDPEQSAEVENGSLKHAFITDLIKYFPGKNTRKQSTDRKPSNKEYSENFPWVLRELAIGLPKVILVMGSDVSRFFLSQFETKRLNKNGQPARRNTPFTNIKNELGNGFQIQLTGAPHPTVVFPIYHPSFQFGSPYEGHDKVVPQIKRILNQ